MKPTPGMMTSAPTAGSIRFEHFRKLLATRTHREIEDVSDADVIDDLEMKPPRKPREEHDRR